MKPNHALQPAIALRLQSTRPVGRVAGSLGHMRVMQILLAKPEDAAKLTEITFAAKRHWGYPERWMENWRHALTIHPEFIASHETQTACVEGELIGFYSLVCELGRMRLEHLWVLPEAMRRGIGRALFFHAVERESIRL